MIAINALMERKLAKARLPDDKCFRDVLEWRRGDATNCGHFNHDVADAPDGFRFCIACLCL